MSAIQQLVRSAIEIRVAADRNHEISVDPGIDRRVELLDHFPDRHGVRTLTGTNNDDQRQMFMTHRIGAQSYGFPQTWLGRVVGGVLAAALFVTAFFFLFVFLLVLGVLILAVLLRLLWRAKKVRAQASQNILEGEYSVVPQEEEIPDDSAADITHKH